ncbi:MULTISPECIES: hypothetical protein [Pantoea]|uniref:Uncharacterized protein n=1 Tax=Pantoea allii TaxID=574096 RepID=A0ABS6VJN0_9GAMM|nr:MULTISPECIES: hypothetical protein [Pantoea]MBW1215933.1 hypothetical protein [Pantoea allii]MBW1259510.1 hypothetical protein [Pantoea allii]MBW1268683.1 hypothetical protein [Pantoea allii]MBW1290691.1 hypothetical protein [Pantoea allii]
MSALAGHGAVLFGRKKANNVVYMQRAHYRYDQNTCASTRLAMGDSTSDDIGDELV